MKSWGGNLILWVWGRNCSCMIRSEHQCDRRLSWSHYLLNFSHNCSDRPVSVLLWPMWNQRLLLLYFFFTMFTSFIHGEGSSWSFNQPDGKERHREGKVIFLVTVRLCAPLVSRHFPFLAFYIFFAFLSSTHYSISIAISLSLSLALPLSLPFSPRGAEVVEGHSDLASFQREWERQRKWDNKSPAVHSQHFRPHKVGKD